MLSARGKIAGESFFNDEIIIHALPPTVAGQVSVDRQRNQVGVNGLVSVALPAQQVIKRMPIIDAVVGGSLVEIQL